MYGSGIFTTRSGLPSCQPSLHGGIARKRTIAFRRAFGDPLLQHCELCVAQSGARPELTVPGFGFHGGMIRRAVTVAICAARLRTSS